MFCYIVHTGSVYVYGSVGNIWSHQSKLLAADGAASDFFGFSVSIYDNTAMIGAFNDDDKATDAGKNELLLYY
jgi:PDZ domain-containing secreted protein